MYEDCSTVKRFLSSAIYLHPANSNQTGTDSLEDRGASGYKNLIITLLSKIQQENS